MDFTLITGTRFKVMMSVEDQEGFPYQELGNSYVCEVVFYTPALQTRPTRPDPDQPTEIILSLASDSGDPTNRVTMDGSTIILDLSADEVDALDPVLLTPATPAGAQIYVYPVGSEDQRVMLTTGRLTRQESSISAVTP